METVTEKGIEILQPSHHSNKIVHLWWIALPYIMYCVGLGLCVYEFVPVEVRLARILVVILIELICLEVSYTTKKNIFSFLPFIVFFLIFRPDALMRGLRGIVNCMLIYYNDVYDGILSLIPGSCSQTDCEAAMAMIELIMGYGCFKSIRKEYHFFTDISIIFIAVILLVFHHFYAIGITLLICSRVSLAFYNHDMVVPSGRVLFMLSACAMFAGISLFSGNINDITEMRESTEETIHDIRYGKNVLPRGNLYEASMMKSQNEEMLQVTTGQEKNLYLRGFTGSQYANGQWSEEKTDSYSGQYDGMLTWLEEKSFNPLYQVSTYYNLCDDSAKPAKNTISIETTGASKEFLYSPISLSYSNARGISEQMDQKFKFTSLFPVKRYTETEMSFSKPSELMIAEDWVENPETKKQKQYAEAESTYRNFVYNTYAVADTRLYELMNQIFWDDYSSDTDGIYSAVTHIRKCLEKLDCTEEIESSNEDPLVLFLNEQIKGNDVFYASAAVQALRAHGLPARYVEGYYVSENMIESSSGNISVTGKNQHAWVEIYFDGIGWLPVDFTPGYYYDSVKLQGMVVSPNVIRKTAMYASEKLEPEKFTDESQSSNLTDLLNYISKPENVPLMLSGLLAIIILLITILGVVTELIRLLVVGRMRKMYQNADIILKCRMFDKTLGEILRTWDISFSLGHDSEYIDSVLSDRIDGIEKGQFLAVKDLLEKVIYGEEQLQGYELRTLEYFFSVLDNFKGKNTHKEKMKKWFFAFRLYKTMNSL